MEDLPESLPKKRTYRFRPKQSAETIAKRIATRRSNGQPWHEVSTKEKISQGLTGKLLTPETRRKQSAAMKGRKQTPEHTANWVKARKAGKGWQPSEEARQKMCVSKRAAWDAMSVEAQEVIRARGRQAAITQRAPLGKQCAAPDCDNLLTRRQLAMKNQCCSTGCSGKVSKRKPKKSGEYRTCPRCDTIQWVPRYRLETWKVCSRKCRRPLMSERALDKLLRHSPEGEVWRRAVYERDGYRCQDCGATQLLHAHHLKSYAKFPELRYDVSNGITVCLWCHKNRHNGKYIPDCRLRRRKSPPPTAAS